MGQSRVRAQNPTGGAEATLPNPNTPCSIDRKGMGEPLYLDMRELQCDERRARSATRRGFGLRAFKDPCRIFLTKTHRPRRALRNTLWAT